jgi:hypothetical protein
VPRQLQHHRDQYQPVSSRTSRLVSLQPIKARALLVLPEPWRRSRRPSGSKLSSRRYHSRSLCWLGRSRRGRLVTPPAMAPIRSRMIGRKGTDVCSGLNRSAANTGMLTVNGSGHGRSSSASAGARTTQVVWEAIRHGLLHFMPSHRLEHALKICTMPQRLGHSDTGAAMISCRVH